MLMMGCQMHLKLNLLSKTLMTEFALKWLAMYSAMLTGMVLAMRFVATQATKKYSQV